MRLLVCPSTASAFQPTSVFPSMDSRSNRSPASRISLWRWDSQYLFVNLKITSKSNSIVSQSHAGEDAPVSTHPHEPRTQIHPWRTLDFRRCFFLFVLSELYSNIALLLLETHATISTKTVLGRMVWRQKIHCLLRIATASHRDDTASGEHLYLTEHTWYEFGSS
jgi:hypothetical protein